MPTIHLNCLDIPGLASCVDTSLIDRAHSLHSLVLAISDTCKMLIKEFHKDVPTTASGNGTMRELIPPRSPLPHGPEPGEIITRSSK